MMSKRDTGHEMIESMESAIDYMQHKKTRAVVHKVEIPDDINVRLIRQKLTNLQLNQCDDELPSSDSLVAHVPK